MLRPSRRLVLAVTMLVVLFLGTAVIDIGLGLKQTSDNVRAMTVPTVVLPPESTATPLPASKGSTKRPAAATPVPTAVPAPDAPINILVMGSDARVGDTESRTDAMIVVHFNPKTNRVSMLSLPRDLNVQVRKYGQYRINTAYYVGEKQLGKGYGAPLAMETVSKLLGIPIHHYALINFVGFEKLIDKLGGITINVPKAIYDPAYPVDGYAGDTRTMKVSFKAGVQKMDGKRALIYSRTRHADNDFGRQARQQQMLMAIFDRIREKNLYANVTSLDDYTGALRDHVRFDMSTEQLLSLGSAAPSVNLSAVEVYTIKPSMLREQARPYYLFINDKKAFANLVSRFVNGEAVAAKSN